MMTSKSPGANLLADPNFKRFISEFAQLSKASEKLSLEEARKLSTQFFLPEGMEFEPVSKCENVKIPGNDGHQIPLRIYVPGDAPAMPVIVYFHRGGWVFGNIDEAEPVCRKLANRLGCVVAAVEYRLAPEHPFPKPLEDCYAAVRWIAQNAGRYSGDRSKLIVCGESAGGNLAAAVSLMARDKGGPNLYSQVLIYPLISSNLVDEAYDNCADRYFITKDAIKFFWSMYVQVPRETQNPYASPDLALDLAKLPPALIVTAEHDPLKLEAENYGALLRQSGVKVISRCFPGVIHGFIDLPIYDESQKNEWIKQIGASLNELYK